jgi:hypothetical protein
MKLVLQERGHEMELMAREKALAEALAAPVSPILYSSSHMTRTFTATPVQYRYCLSVQVRLSVSSFPGCHAARLYVADASASPRFLRTFCGSCAPECGPQIHN